MNLYQQFCEQPLSPTNIHLRSFHTQRITTEPKDIGPWHSVFKRPTPRQYKSYKNENSSIFKFKKDKNNTLNMSNNLQQDTVKMKRFKTHVFQFIDQSKISQVCPLQKERKPYTFRQFELSDFLPQEKESSSKNPIQPVFISLLKYKKQKLKNRMKQIADRLTKNKSNSANIPSLSNRELLEGKSRIVSLDYHKVNFKITTRSQRSTK